MLLTNQLKSLIGHTHRDEKYHSIELIFFLFLGECEASEDEIVSEDLHHHNSADLILKKQKFLTELLESKNSLSIPARRASAESLSSPYLHDNEGDCDKSKNSKMRPKQSTLPTSLSVTSDLNRGDNL